MKPKPSEWQIWRTAHGTEFVIVGKATGKTYWELLVLKPFVKRAMVRIGSNDFENYDFIGCALY